MRQPVTTIDIRRDLVGLLPRLRRFAMTLTGDVAAADELVQSVCQRAVAKSQQWNGEGRLESWVYTLARHLWNDEGRKRRPRPAAPKGNVTDIREAARERATVTDTDLVHRMLAEMRAAEVGLRRDFRFYGAHPSRWCGAAGKPAMLS